MNLIKHGTVSLDKLHQLTKNAKLTVLAFICLCFKMFNKFFCQSSPNNKDGTLSGSNGLTWSSVDWKDLFILMLMEKNGCKPMLEPLGLFWKFLKNKVEFLKLNKLKRMVNHISKFIWINKPLKLKVNMQLGNSFNIFRFTNQQLISKEELLTSTNIWRWMNNTWNTER